MSAKFSPIARVETRTNVDVVEVVVLLDALLSLFLLLMTSSSSSSSGSSSQCNLFNAPNDVPFGTIHAIGFVDVDGCVVECFDDEDERANVVVGMVDDIVKDANQETPARTTTL
jgi:hypothetical protein